MKTSLSKVASPSALRIIHRKRRHVRVAARWRTAHPRRQDACGPRASCPNHSNKQIAGEVFCLDNERVAWRPVVNFATDSTDVASHGNQWRPSITILRGTALTTHTAQRRGTRRYIKYAYRTRTFYPPRGGASSARALVIIVCPSVCVTRQYCIKTAKRRITQTTPRDSPGTLVL